VNKDIGALLRKVRKLGYPVERPKRGAGHWKVLSKDGTRMLVSVSGSPSDWHNYQNTLRDLRRAGIKL
jgi:hypothetical protein